MFALLPSTAIVLLLFTYLHPTFAAPLPTIRGDPIRPVSWISDFHGEIHADTVMELEWTGGSGTWEVYYVPQWAEEENYAPVTIAITSEPSMKWHTPKLDAYPPDTTFIMVVKDVHQGEGGKWFDTTSLLNFVAP